MQLAPDGIGGLFGERADLVVTHLFIRDQQQQQAILRRQAVQRFWMRWPSSLVSSTRSGVRFRRGRSPKPRRPRW